MPAPRSRVPRPLTKSQFVAGVQCHKLLWWRVHEPNAPELVPTPDQQARFDAGRYSSASAFAAQAVGLDPTPKWLGIAAYLALQARLRGNGTEAPAA